MRSVPAPPNTMHSSTEFAQVALHGFQCRVQPRGLTCNHLLSTHTNALSNSNIHASTTFHVNTFTLPIYVRRVGSVFVSSLSTDHPPFTRSLCCITSGCTPSAEKERSRTTTHCSGCSHRQNFDQGRPEFWPWKRLKSKARQMRGSPRPPCECWECPKPLEAHIAISEGTLECVFQVRSANVNHFQ